MQTLELLLDTTSGLNSTVDIKGIFISLMEKLGKFAQCGGGGAGSSAQGNELISTIDKDLNIFGLFKKYTDKIITDQGTSLEVSKLLELETAFMNFSIKTYPGNT